MVPQRRAWPRPYHSHAPRTPHRTKRRIRSVIRCCRAFRQRRAASAGFAGGSPGLSSLSSSSLNLRQPARPFRRAIRAPIQSTSRLKSNALGTWLRNRRMREPRRGGGAGILGNGTKTGVNRHPGALRQVLLPPGIYPEMRAAARIPEPGTKKPGLGGALELSGADVSSFRGRGRNGD